MSRSLKMEYAGTLYHVASRGDSLEDSNYEGRVYAQGGRRTFWYKFLSGQQDIEEFTIQNVNPYLFLFE